MASPHAQHRFGEIPVQPNAGGQSLPQPVQKKMQALFGADFSTVRIHEGSDALALEASAYTQGDNIHFAPGFYQPASLEGQALIGHELTHVLQQRRGRAKGYGGHPAAIDPDQRSEADAEQMGADIAQGRPGSVASGLATAAPSGSIQRAPFKNLRRWLGRKTGLALGASGREGRAQRGGQANQAPPINLIPIAPPVQTASPLDQFVTAYGKARYYHSTGDPDNVSSIEKTGLLNYEDRLKILGHDVGGMSTRYRDSPYQGDEKKGVFLGAKPFARANVESGTLGPNFVRLYLPAERAVIHQTQAEEGVPSHQLRPDPKFRGGGMITKDSIPARQTLGRPVLDLLDQAETDDSVANEKLTAIHKAVGSHYPEGSNPPSKIEMATLLREAIKQRRLSNAALDQ